MSTLSQQYDKWRGQFDGLTQRERTLSVVAALCLVLLGGFVLAVEPQMKDLERQTTELQRQQGIVEQLSRQVDELTQALSSDPNAPLIARLEAMAKEDVALDQQLAQRTEDLVPANQMPKLLGSMFAEFETLELVEMQSIKPVALLQVDENAAPIDVNLYQHGVRLKLEGRYFDIQSYLQRVESLPWHFYWKRFDYQVTEYPLAQVEIEIYTLSTSRAFIGVWNDG